jgi:hypothetical protein
MAVAILNMFPSAGHLDWLAQRFPPKNERPFLAYQSQLQYLRQWWVSRPTIAKS